MLTNCDVDLFALTAPTLGVTIDRVVTAQDVRSYKPALAHFHRFRETIGDAPWVHVACSWFHDIAPARTVGIPRIWVDRDRTGDDPSIATRVLPNLESLATVSAHGDAMTLGILVGGGPAPGINGVIASAASEAMNCGMRVLGIYDGYRDLAAGTPAEHRRTHDRRDGAHRQRRRIDTAYFAHESGRKTKRRWSAASPASARLGIRYLLCIGGDDTTFGAAKIAERTGGRIGVATVPKTIDNDLPLPDNAPTFGFETARSVGAQIIESLIEDARTTTRWYVVVSMGRKSGALALGMCKAAGATLAVIPEEFPAQSALSAVIDTIAGAIVKQRAFGRSHGVAVVAEGIAERVSVDALATHSTLPNATRSVTCG